MTYKCHDLWIPPKSWWDLCFLFRLSLPLSVYRAQPPALNRLNDPNTTQAVSVRCCAHLWHLGSPFAWRLELVDLSERNAQGSAKGSANASLLHLAWCNATAGDLCHIQCSPAGKRHPCLFNPSIEIITNFNPSIEIITNAAIAKIVAIVISLHTRARQLWTCWGKMSVALSTP